MATGGKRNPSTHRTPAQETTKRREFDASPKQKKLRAERNAARREFMQAGRVSKGDTLQVDHIQPLSRGGGNAKSNLRVVPGSKNVAWDAKKKRR